MSISSKNIKQFSDLRIITIDGEDYFNIYDIGFYLGYTKKAKGKSYLMKDRLENMCNALSIFGNNLHGNYKITKDIDFENTYIEFKNMITITRYSKSKNKIKFGLWLEDKFNVVVGDLKLADDYIPLIKESLKMFNPVKEFNVLNYRIDLYFPNYKIAVECDEYCHKDTILHDDIRQEEIEEKLGCKFIRFEPRKDLNIGIVINNILQIILSEYIKSNPLPTAI